MTLENLTERDIKKRFKASSLRKARAYLNRLQNLNRSGNTLTAEVSGTRRYHVEIDVDKLYRSLDDEHHRVFKAMSLLGSEPGIVASDLEKLVSHWGRPIPAFWNKLKLLHLKER